MADPKKGKKHGRRLYTDENPKDTVGIKFATPADARLLLRKLNVLTNRLQGKITE